MSKGEKHIMDYETFYKFFKKEKEMKKEEIGSEKTCGCDCASDVGVATGSGGSGVNMGMEANAGMVGDDSSTNTRLISKNWSPLLVRKYYVKKWPMWIGLICDCNLNDLDQVVNKIIKEGKELGFLDGKIQSGRNFCGLMSDRLDDHYNSIKTGSTEGVAVSYYQDKCFYSSLSSDMMVHKSCRDEYYHILKILPHI